MIKTLIKLLFIFKTLYSQEACKQEDISFIHSKCLNKKQNFLFFFNSNCNPELPQSVDLPSSMLNSDCAVCGKGSYFGYQNSTLGCIQCPANTYSLGGSLRIDGVSHEWTGENKFWNKFTSSCYTMDKDTYEISRGESCSSWKLTGAYLSSGLSNSPGDYYFTDLKISVKLLYDGNVTFKYRMFSFDNSDVALNFLVDYDSKYDDYTINHQLKEVSVPLSEGFHTLYWQYSQESSSEDSGAGLHIVSIDIEGVEGAAFECLKCNNSSSKPGSSMCEVCRAGTYYDDEESVCKTCPDGTDSEPNSVGVASCLPLRDCVEEDFERVVSEKCSSNVQVVLYALDPNTRCNNTSGLHEQPDEVECQPCSYGKYKVGDDNNYECSYCVGDSFLDPNTGKCEKCNGVTGRYLQIKNSFKEYFNVNLTNIGNFTYTTLSANLTTIFNEGLIEVEFTRDLGSISYKINDQLETLREPRKKLSIETSLGTQRIEIGFMGLLNVVSSIVIRNTNLGGGVSCDSCNSGYITVDDYSNKVCNLCPAGMTMNPNITYPDFPCEKCPSRTYKSSNDDACRKCPAFTTSNEQGTSCVLLEVLNNKAESLRYVISGLISSQMHYLCEIANGLCIDSFYGPISDGANLYFISLNQSSSIDITHFSYEDDSDLDEAFVYALMSNNKSNDQASKTLVNLGSRIESVRLIKDGGIVITYADGDNCNVEGETSKFKTKISLTCSTEDKYTAPIFSRVEGCVYYFEWPTRYACPSCLKSQTSILYTPCVIMKRTVVYTPNTNCIIEDPRGKLGELITFKGDSLVIESSDDVDTNSVNPDQLSKANPFVDYERVYENCNMTDDYNEDIFYFLIAIPIVYVLFFLCLARVCCKYKRISSQYRMLVEDSSSVHAKELRSETDSYKRTETNNNQQMELVIETSNK